MLNTQVCTLFGAAAAAATAAAARMPNSIGFPGENPDFLLP